MNVLFIGFGSVARTTYIIWNEVLSNKLGTAIVIDPLETLDIQAPNIIHYSLGLTRDNYADVLSDITTKHQIDIIVDLSVHVGGVEMVDWAVQHDIPYVNTALEDWDDFPTWNGQLRTLFDHTLYKRQLFIKKKYGNEKTVTCCVDHGMNPGMISHFVKRCLSMIGRERGIVTNTYAELAEALKLRVIHISERDTQITNKPMEPDTFYNTWSSIGFVEEATDPAQIGWGTHEKTYPLDTVEPNIWFPDTTDIHQVFLNKRSMDVYIQSYEPVLGPFVGYCISHSEASTLPYFLATDTYRPSVYYVYLPSAMAIKGLRDVEANHYQMLNNYHVYSSQDISEGLDSVGAYMIFGDEGNYEAYWAGTVVTNTEAKAISPLVSATSIQVAVGVLSAVDYCIHHPRDGVLFPEYLDTTRVFELIEKLMGNIICAKLPIVPTTDQFVKLRIA